VGVELRYVKARFTGVLFLVQGPGQAQALDPGFRIQDSAVRIQDSGFGIQVVCV
jgi:hypothetical protein